MLTDDRGAVWVWGEFHGVEEIQSILRKQCLNNPVSVFLNITSLRPVQILPTRP